MARTGAISNRGAALLAAALLFGGLMSQADAQSTGTTTSSQKQTNRKPVGAAGAKPAATIERATAPDGGSWTLDDALYTRRAAPLSAGATSTVTERAPLGRVQVNQGTFGIETETRVKDGRFSDGRRVPGLETQKRDDPSFFGLSLSVPTTDKSLIPVPLLPRSE